MAAKQLILPANRAFNSNGIAVPGAQAKLYTTGTLTPANFYFDSALTVSLGSTITANGAGRFTPMPYQDEATAFRLRILDASGTELDDIDPFYFGTAVTDNVAAAQAAASSAQQYASLQLTSVSATTRTLAAADKGKCLEFTAATSVTVTVPTGLGSDFFCTIAQMGTGQVTVSAASGVTLLNKDSQFKTQAQYAELRLRATSTAETLKLDGPTA